MRSVRRYLVLLSLAVLTGLLAVRFVVAPLTIRLLAKPIYDPSRFEFSKLQGAEMINPTTLQFGPDGALYVGTRLGALHRFDVAREPSGFRVRSAQSIAAVREIPNHDDSGQPRPELSGRLITGLAIAGSAGQPVLYVSSSDPRIERPQIDTNSGVVSRLVRTQAGWRRTDLVRGLPRSRHDHAPNGLALDAAGKTLFLSVGSLTNMGAPSAPFGLLREYPLSASILSLDLERIGEDTIDLSTLDDPGRPGALDDNDPFGGNDGRNQAMLPSDGRVRLHAEGLRNAYDLVSTPAGLFTIDNGSNEGFGGLPTSASGSSANAIVEGGRQGRNPLYWIAGPGLFYGHPNLSRPAPASKPVPPLDTFRASTNGLALYPSGRESGRIALVTVSLDRTLSLLLLDPKRPWLFERTILLANFGGMPLDVWVAGEASGFAGSIWIADMGNSAIYVLAPVQASRSWIPPGFRSPLRTAVMKLLLWGLRTSDDLIDSLQAAAMRLRGA